MKKFAFVMALISLPLTGCSMGFVPAELVPAKPYLDHWDKPGMTEEERRRDSASCGGTDEGAPKLSRNTIKETKRADETENQTYSRLFYDLQRCMLKKGYRFTGKCDGNEVSRASPACGAP